jgi:predicted metalloprotease with PDZ domain
MLKKGAEAALRRHQALNSLEMWRAEPTATSRRLGRRGLALLLGLVCSLGIARTALAAPPAMSYLLDLRHPGTHLIGVTWTIPQAAPSIEIQFPAWNATYQIRDFVRHVQDLSATCDGKPAKLRRLDLDTWRDAAHPCASLELTYSVYANDEGPFGAVLGPEHAFLNLAMVLFYLPYERGRPCQFKALMPEGWKIASVLGEPDNSGEFRAASYDELVDAPAEAGAFQVYNYEQGLGGQGEKKATYRIIVHADPSVYSSARLLESLEKITATETALMNDLPFGRYTFIFHFTDRGRGGGGMEHADGTAITVGAANLQNRWEGFESVVAHEFFHAWNVKRIRPAGLEPVDYVHGNDTRDLWLSEGVTSAYGLYATLRAGVIDRAGFYERLGNEIRELQSRPARLRQSLETSGREAWLEKYPDYWRPERSISYYNKGELVGILLDLAIRHASGNDASLDGVMRRLNTDFAVRHRFFTQADLVATIREVAPQFKELDRFFDDYLTGTRELDYDTTLGYAGLRLVSTSVEEPALGFRATRAESGEVTVESVDPDSNAAKAGLRAGDALVSMNGQPLSFPPQARGMKSGSKVEFEIRRGREALKMKFDLGQAESASYRVEEIPDASPAQRLLRDDWLSGRTEP